MQEHVPERCYNPSEEGVGLGLSGLNARCFRFGPFELNSQTCELRKHGVKLKLPEQPCKFYWHLSSVLVNSSAEDLKPLLWIQTHS